MTQRLWSESGSDKSLQLPVPHEFDSLAPDIQPSINCSKQSRDFDLGTRNKINTLVAIIWQQKFIL